MQPGKSNGLDDEHLNGKAGPVTANGTVVEQSATEATFPATTYTYPKKS